MKVIKIQKIHISLKTEFELESLHILKIKVNNLLNQNKEI